MLPPGQYAGLVRIPAVVIPGAPCIFDRALHAGIPSAQPLRIARYFPFAEGFEHAAHLSVDAGAERGRRPADRKLEPESEPSLRLEVVSEIEFAHRTLEVRKQVRQRICVIPDVRAGAFAAAGHALAPLECVEFAVLEPHAGRGFERRKIGGNRVKHLRRQRRIKQRIAETERLRFQAAVILKQVIGDLRGPVELRRIPVAPARILPVAGIPVVPAVRIVPGQSKDDAARFARRDFEAERQSAGVTVDRTGCMPVGEPGGVPVVAFGEFAGAGEIVPEGIEVVNPGPAVPAALAG